MEGKIMTWMELLERVIAKVTSGRFIFTIVAAGVFCYMSINSLLKENQAMEILLIVVYAYFNRPNNQANNGSQTDTTTTLPPRA
jgi:hypothetical protein